MTIPKSLTFPVVPFVALTGVLAAQQRSAATAVEPNHVFAGSVFSGPSPDRRTTRPPVQRVVFVDLSDSPWAGDATRWLDAAEREVFSELRFGDSVLIFGVHDHTAESAPIFDASVPLLPPDASMEVTVHVRRTLLLVRAAGKEKLQAALRAPAHSPARIATPYSSRSRPRDRSSLSFRYGGEYAGTRSGAGADYSRESRRPGAVGR